MLHLGRKRWPVLAWRLILLAAATALAAGALGAAGGGATKGAGGAGGDSGGGGEVPKPAPLIKNGAWASLLKSHPRLEGPPAYLKQVAIDKTAEYKGLQKGLPDMYAHAVTHAEKALARGEKDANVLGITRYAGAVYALQGPGGMPNGAIKRMIDDAMKLVGEGHTNQHQHTWIKLHDVAQVYDYFYPELSSAQRQKMIEWFNAHLGYYKLDEDPFHNSLHEKIQTYLEIAYATWGENPRAKEFRDDALGTLYEGKLVPVLKEFGRGGGFTECGWYTLGCLWHLVQGLELARRFEGYDGFAKAPVFFYDRMAVELLQCYPGLWLYGANRYPVEGDGGSVYGFHDESPRLTAEVLSQYFRGSNLARYVVHMRRKGSNPEAQWENFLWEEPPDKPLDLAALPPAHLCTAIGKVYARSDWTDGASWMRFDCSPYFTQHDHLDSGNFEIFRYEPLATESGEYANNWNDPHAVNWLVRTIAHNCILVNEPGEQWKGLRGDGPKALANDGGQGDAWGNAVNSLEAWHAKEKDFRRAQIVAYQNTNEYMYVAGDCTHAYAPSKMAGFIRQIVFVRPHTFVIFDRVQSTRADYAKTWLLHCAKEPTITGQSFSTTDGKGTLSVQTLLPLKASIKKIHGYTYGGQSFPAPKDDAINATAVLWRIEVQPTQARTDDLFLHVLCTDQPVKAELVDKGDSKGVRIGATTVLFSGKVGGTITVGGKDQKLEAKVQTGLFE